MLFNFQSLDVKIDKSKKHTGKKVINKKNLDKELSIFDNYFNFNYIFDEIKSEVFIDIVHTNDIGNKIFVKNLSKIIKK